MSFEQRGLIAADHSGLAGHFPGNPIVPGVVLLDEVLRAFAAWRPADRPMGIPQVKFLAPLRPEQPFTILLRESDGGEIRFDCLGDDGRLLARGRLTLAGDGTGRGAVGDAVDALPTAREVRKCPASSGLLYGRFVE